VAEPRKKNSGRRWLEHGQDVEGARLGSSATGTTKRGSEAVGSPRQLTNNGDTTGTRARARLWPDDNKASS